MIIWCWLFPLSIISWAFSQNLGKSFDGAYTARISIVIVSGSSTVKKSVSLFPWLFFIVILQPLFFFKKTSMPLLVDGFPWIVYLAKSWRYFFFSVVSFCLQRWESITMLISLVRSKKVCNFADSLYVPLFDSLRLVEVIVILLDDLALCGFIFVKLQT